MAADGAPLDDGAALVAAAMPPPSGVTSASGRPADAAAAARLSVPIDGRHGERDLAVPDEVLELVCAPVGVDRHDRHAERIERQPVKQELGAVEEQEPGAVAVTVARRDA